MTPEQIDKLEAGRELDALVAEKVFNYDGICQVAGCSERHDPRYSTDIAAAWLVVEKLQQLDKLGDFSTATDFLTPWSWLDYSNASDMALFICKTALKAIIGYDPDLHGRFS